MRHPNTNLSSRHRNRTLRFGDPSLGRVRPREDEVRARVDKQDVGVHEQSAKNGWGLHMNENDGKGLYVYSAVSCLRGVRRKVLCREG
ncbi:hypothetical protein RJT34_12322 [Clitoria ternatea]|uniref:Uncharacterized protein n=1 Tax=Clitoria ternatea TaxID=43366 RepID=A0AAN9PKK5_CLITE